MATGLADEQTTFTKTMEYYMYRIGVQFRTNPHLLVRLKKMSGATPPTPTAPSHWPTRTIEDHQTIVQLEADILKKDQKLRLKICANTALETTVSDLVEDLCKARSRTEALHSDMAVLHQAHLVLRKIQSDSLIKAKTDDHPSHLSTAQANVQAEQARQMNLFLQKEVARLIGENKHTFELAKAGYQAEVSRLREEIRDLNHKLSAQAPEATTSTSHSPAYSGKIRSLKQQVSNLQIKLDAAMAVNKPLQEEKQATSPPTSDTEAIMTPAIADLHSQIHHLTTALQSAKSNHQSDMEQLTSDKDKLILELRSEIAILHAEHQRDKDNSQSAMAAKDQEITSLHTAVSEASSKAQADINAAHKAQQRIAHAGCLPLATLMSLQAEITEHLITIVDLQSEIQDLKYNMEDITTTAARDLVERDLGNTERKYVAAHSDLSTTKIELFQTTENLNRVLTELKDTKEDLYSIKHRWYSLPSKKINQFTPRTETNDQQSKNSVQH